MRARFNVLLVLVSFKVIVAITSVPPASGIHAENDITATSSSVARSGALHVKSPAGMRLSEGDWCIQGS